MTNFNRTKMLVLLLMSIIFSTSFLSAKQVSKIDGVTYLQMPTKKPIFSTADVFVSEDRSKTTNAISFGLGKLTGGSTAKGSNIDQLVQGVFSDKVKNFTTWNLAKIFGINTDDKKLKVVLTYSPDDSARPMMKPRKNKNGKYVFRYRVNSSMKIFDENNKLILEKEFAAISGQGTSRTWNTGQKKLIQASNKKNNTPYEDACRDGVITYAKKIVYGLYGIEKFPIAFGAAKIKKQKDSKKYMKKFNKIIESKKGLLLSDSQINGVKDCLKYWESIVSSTNKKYLWQVHYNLAIGYAWIVNAEKSNEEINKVYELNKSIFDKIKHKNGSFRGRDLDILTAYNEVAPFCHYYAQGVANYPDIPKMLSIDTFTVSHALAYNLQLASVFHLPVNLPIFPYKKSGINMKKCSGEVTLAGQPIFTFKYNLHKGNLESINVKGAKKSEYKKIKSEIDLPNIKDVEYRDRNYIHTKLSDCTLSSKFKLAYGPKIVFLDLKKKSHNGFKPFVLPDAKKIINESQYAGYNACFTKTNFIKEDKIAKNKWASLTYTINDSIDVTLTSPDISVSSKAIDIDENGMPKKYTVTYKVVDGKIGIHVNVKKKVFEQTSTGNARQSKAQRKLGPVIEKRVLDHLRKNVKNLKENDDKISYEYTETFDCSYKLDKKGNWTEFKIGDYKITREIKD